MKDPLLGEYFPQLEFCRTRPGPSSSMRLVYSATETSWKIEIAPNAN